MTAPAPISSPCIKVCIVDGKRGLCIGCGRTLAEIAGWGAMDEERRRNLAQQIGRIKNFHQLFVISHDDSFEGFTDQVVTLA